MTYQRSILNSNSDQATILRTLVQGEEGRAWADEREQGWTLKSNIPGELDLLVNGESFPDI